MSSPQQQRWRVEHEWKKQRETSIAVVPDQLSTHGRESIDFFQFVGSLQSGHLTYSCAGELESLHSGDRNPKWHNSLARANSNARHTQKWQARDAPVVFIDSIQFFPIDWKDSIEKNDSPNCFCCAKYSGLFTCHERSSCGAASCMRLPWEYHRSLRKSSERWWVKSSHCGAEWQLHSHYCTLAWCWLLTICMFPFPDVILSCSSWSHGCVGSGAQALLQDLLIKNMETLERAWLVLRLVVTSWNCRFVFYVRCR